MKVTSNAVPIPKDRERERQSLSRRRFLTSASALGLASLALRAPVLGAGHVYESGITYHLPKVDVKDPNPGPFGWECFSIPKSSEGVALTWPGDTALSGPSRFRFTPARGSKKKVIEAYLLGSGRVVGELEMVSTATLRPNEIKLSSEDTQEVLDQGLGLRVVEGNAFSIFHPEAATAPWDNHAQLPHLIEDKAANPLGELYARMASYSVLQRFGWQQQCVWNGLLDLADVFEDQGFRDAWKAQLPMFVNQQGKITDIRWGNEDAGCCVFYELDTDKHWAVPDQGLAIVKKATGGYGSTEGCYTLGYPLCLWGEIRGDDKLKDLGVKELLGRKNNLHITPDTINQRRGTFPNWARGVAWYCLGFARSLDYLQGHPQYQAVADEAAACVHHARKYQRDDGLWDVFMHEEGTGRDTSGSSGVAAACAMAARHGIEKEAATEVAEKAFEGLQSHLRPDGLLGGAAPENVGGEALQRSGYRVIYPMAMGLMAQLAGSLAKLGMTPRAAAR